MNLFFFNVQHLLKQKIIATSNKTIKLRRSKKRYPEAAVGTGSTPVDNRKLKKVQGITVSSSPSPVLLSVWSVQPQSSGLYSRQMCYPVCSSPAVADPPQGLTVCVLPICLYKHHPCKEWWFELPFYFGSKQLAVILPKTVIHVCVYVCARCFCSFCWSGAQSKSQFPENKQLLSQSWRREIAQSARIMVG